MDWRDSCLGRCGSEPGWVWVCAGGNLTTVISDWPFSRTGQAFGVDDGFAQQQIAGNGLQKKFGLASDHTSSDIGSGDDSSGPIQYQLPARADHFAWVGQLHCSVRYL